MTNKNQNLMQLIKLAHGLITSSDLEKQRQSQESIGAILGNTKEITYTEFQIGDMRAEWISVNRAHMKKYIILYCHGGGYSAGSCVYARTLTSKLAMSTSMDVLCFDYRLAPENPYPAALEEAVKVWDYLMLLGYGARDVIIAGDSAGGNLALALVHTLKEERRLMPRGLVLMSPWTDLTCSGKSHVTKADIDPVLNEEYLDKARFAYAGECDMMDPKISPLFGDFQGFPSTYIQVGDNEVLYSDAARLHRRMTAAKVSVRMDHYEGMWHVFQMSPLKKAYAAMDRIAEFIFDICR